MSVRFRQEIQALSWRSQLICNDGAATHPRQAQHPRQQFPARRGSRSRIFQWRTPHLRTPDRIGSGRGDHRADARRRHRAAGARIRRGPGSLRTRVAEGSPGPRRDRRARRGSRVEGRSRFRCAAAEDPGHPVAVASLHDPHGARGACAGSLSGAPARRRAGTAGSRAMEIVAVARVDRARRRDRGPFHRRTVHRPRISAREVCTDMSTLERIGQETRALARRAGAAILEIYAGSFSIEHKGDDSPLTAADMAAHRVIVEGLHALTPDLPILSEESAGIDWSERRNWNRYWLVDPLDGTREFIKRNGEFTVNIALIEDHSPVLGVVLTPVTGELHFGVRDEGAFLESAPGALLRPIETRAA